MAEPYADAGRIEPAFAAVPGGEDGPPASEEPGSAVATRKGHKRGRKPARRGGRKRRQKHGLLYRAVRALLVLFVVGAAGLAGLVAYYASQLPPMADWTVPARAANVRILAADGSLITNHSDSTGQRLSLDEMSPYVPEAVVAIEDRRFYQHFGVDPIGLARAMFINLRAGTVVQGGSTITQQLAKNLFLQPDRTFKRKVQEVILAFWLEMNLSKKQILQLYLNRVYLGSGAYGVDAAAHRYFGKSARNLTLAEAATIAGLLKAPSHYSPITNPGAAEARAQLVLTAMHQAGYIDDREATLALATQVKAVRDVAGGSGRYVADWVMSILPGYVGAVDRDIVVQTSIDLRLQAAADAAVAGALAAEGAKLGVTQGALVAIDPDGAVKAMVGGRDYATSPYNRAVDGRRQPGSAFKLFVYLTALEHGLIPESVRVDQPVSIGNWTPQNYAKKYYGPVTLRTALALSLNTVSVQLTNEVGPTNVAATARRLGITTPLMATPSIALGTSEVSPLEMTAAFVPFSNGGRGIIPHVIDRITTADGRVLYQRSGSGPGQVIDPRYVAMMNNMLQAVVSEGTGKRAALSGWQVAGKTGTSQDYRDAWFIGYTGALTTGVWFGNDDDSPSKRATGGSIPADAWHRFMVAALDGVRPVDLPGDYRLNDPANLIAAGSSAAPMDATGQPLLLQGGNGGTRPFDAIGALAQSEDLPPPSAPPPPRQSKGLLERLFGG